MIIDTVNHLSEYTKLNPRFAVVVEFLKAHDLSSMEPGIHKIDGDDVYVNIQSAPAKQRSEARFETHRCMIDIQVPISAKEEHGWCPAAELPIAEYDAQTDMTLHDPVAPQTPEDVARMYFSIQPGECAIYFPTDGHAPAISPVPFKKAIFKVKI